MSSSPTNPAIPATPSRKTQVLDTALDQSHEVKEEVDEVADELGETNDHASAQIAQGVSTLPAGEALQKGLAVEKRVEEVADDLQEVIDHLSDGVHEVREVELALDQSHAALAESEAALALSRSAEHRASERAMHDQKTGLPNRTLFDDRLAQAIAAAERHGWLLAIMFMDLDRFKLVNDTHGHAAGDAVLAAVAERLTRKAREEDTVCRNGGDEFLYLLIDPASREAVARIAGLVREAVESPIHVGDLQFAITSSIGIALYPEHGTDGPSLIAHADAAMYHAKQIGSSFEFFEPSMAASLNAKRPMA